VSKRTLPQLSSFRQNAQFIVTLSLRTMADMRTGAGHPGMAIVATTKHSLTLPLPFIHVENFLSNLLVIVHWRTNPLSC
jgi:hypothetical protein